MFNPNFDKVSPNEIVNELKTKGYFVFEEALTEKYVDELLQEVDFDRVLVNTNDVGVVIAKTQKFLTHCLATSKKAYDIITCQKVLDICSHYFNDSYKIINHRIYQTTKASHMPWHTDNNRQVGKQLDSKHDMPGILFLIYLSDVTQNPFQVVKDSHNWSHKYSHEIYLSDRFIEENYQQDVMEFLMKKGTIFVCDIHTVHRAKPFIDKNYIRKTLLFQVDQVGSENIGHGEKNIINTEFIDNRSQELMDYLGFGFKRDYPAFPSTSVATMTPKDMLTLQKQLFSQTIQAVARNFVASVLPGELIVNLKRMIWHFKSKGSKSD